MSVTTEQLHTKFSFDAIPSWVLTVFYLQDGIERNSETR